MSVGLWWWLGSGFNGLCLALARLRNGAESCKLSASQSSVSNFQNEGVATTFSRCCRRDYSIDRNADIYCSHQHHCDFHLLSTCKELHNDQVRLLRLDD